MAERELGHVLLTIARSAIADKLAPARRSMTSPTQHWHNPAPRS